MKERNDFEQWNDYVNSFERNEAWRMSLEIANMVLEAYFQSRDSFPGTSLMGKTSLMTPRRRTRLSRRCQR